MLKLLRGKSSRPSDGQPGKAQKRPLLRGVVKARYDAAQTTDENRRHWAGADQLGPDAAANPRVRATLRSRARYEVANNSYARGIVLTLANDTVGTGPRLQMLTDDPQANTVIEQAFMRWCRAVNLAEKLRTMRMARAESGEAFAVFTNNPKIASDVTLDLKLIETDQVTTPVFSGREPKNPLGRQANDGIVFDPHGNPVEYCILKDHPGESTRGGQGMQFDRVPAESVIHLFRPDRPGQTRGIPELTAALPLFAQLRRYRLAVLAAAETAADFALTLYTDAPPNGEPDAVEPMDVFELEARMATTLPQGWKLGQVKAEHPSTNHVEFVMSILAEIARCLNMPFNVAAGNSSGYNYASGRLDHQTYYKAIRVGYLNDEITVTPAGGGHEWIKKTVQPGGVADNKLLLEHNDWDEPNVQKSDPIPGNLVGGNGVEILQAQPNLAPYIEYQEVRDHFDAKRHSLLTPQIDGGMQPIKHYIKLPGKVYTDAADTTPGFLNDEIITDPPGGGPSWLSKAVDPGGAADNKLLVEHKDWDATLTQYSIPSLMSWENNGGGVTTNPSTPPDGYAWIEIETWRYSRDRKGHSDLVGRQPDPLPLDPIYLKWLALPHGLDVGEMLYWDGLKWVILSPPVSGDHVLMSSGGAPFWQQVQEFQCPGSGGGS